MHTEKYYTSWPTVIPMVGACVGHDNATQRCKIYQTSGSNRTYP